MRFSRAACAAWVPAGAAAFIVALALPLVAGAGCVSGSGPGLLEPQEAGAPPSVGLDDRDAAPMKRDVDLGDPFAVEGLTPSHGAWSGGARTTVRGRGFPTKLRVWLGGSEVPPGDVFASDPTRAAIVVPRGLPGAVDVKIRDDATAQERTLPGGFVYDGFVVEPSSGATGGGTRIALKGSGTAWTAGTAVAIGGQACADVVVAASDRLECTTAGQAAGAKDVTVTTPDGAVVQVRDAYTYSDSPDGYRGGLSGGALAGKLRVLAIDAFTGTPLAGARVIVGGDLATATIKRTDAAGLAEFTSPSLTGKITVTVVAKCHQPITFADVPVDTVTTYLNPTLDPACAEGDPPSTGNRTGRNGAEISGELIWPGGIELQRASWGNVPAPVRATERQAAYVFVAAGSPQEGFGLPDGALAITPASDGRRGYAYSLITFPGNLTIYALAGVEDRSFTPPRFTPYVMGFARGVSAQPNVRTTAVDIPMASILDHTVTLAPEPPPQGPRGPDRFRANLAVSLSTNAFAILPWSAKERALPLAGTVSFVGVPALVNALASEAFVVSASVGTGPGAGAPASVIARLRTTDTSNTLAVSGFLPVPVLAAPGAGTWNGTSLHFRATGTADLVEATVSSANGLVTWTIVAPGSARDIPLPDLSSPALGSDNVGLRRGTIQTTLYIARIEQFSYARLRYGQLSSATWNAYALDSLAGAY